MARFAYWVVTQKILSNRLNIILNAKRLPHTGALAIPMGRLERPRGSHAHPKANQETRINPWEVVMNQQQITPVTFTSPVTADGLRAALDEHGLIEQRVLVRFYGAAKCIVNKHQRKLLHQTTGHFFVEPTGFYASSRQPSGEAVTALAMPLRSTSLPSIEPITKVQLSDEQKRAKDVARFKSLLRRAHPNFDAEWLRSVNDGKCTQWQVRVSPPVQVFFKLCDREYAESVRSLHRIFSRSLCALAFRKRYEI